MKYECERCGAPLQERKDGKYICAYCDTVYTEEDFMEASQLDIRRRLKNLETRVFDLIEMGEFNQAERYIEQMLDLDSENAMAYYARLLIDYHLNLRASLKDLNESFEDNPNYRMVLRYGDDALIQEITSYLEAVQNRIQNEQKDSTYRMAKARKERADSAEEYKQLYDIFIALDDYLDAESLAQECLAQSEVLQKSETYHQAKNDMMLNTAEGYDRAIAQLEKLGDYRDSKALIKRCIERRKALLDNLFQENRKNSSNKTLVIVFVVVVVLAFLLISGGYGSDHSNTAGTTGNVQEVTDPLDKKYQEAMRKKETGDYYEAMQLFIELDNYESSYYLLAQCVDQYYGEGTTERIGEIQTEWYTVFGKNEWVPLKLELAEDGCRYLMVSRECVAQLPYDDEKKKAGWSDAAIREWLNEEYLKQTFTKAEQKRIVPYETSILENTDDYIFLLSELEISDKAYKHRLSLDDIGEWYLRDVKNTAKKPCVESYGYMRFSEKKLNEKSGIRPAFWLNLGTNK